MKPLLKNVHFFIFVPLAFAFWSPGHSQDLASGQTPPPGPPYVGALSGDFTFVKKITYAGQDLHLTAEQKAAQDFLSPASTKTKELDAVKKGSVRKDEELFTDGSSRETWKIDSYRLTVYSAHPDSIIVNILATSDDPTAPNQYRDAADFPELNWIKGSTFQGIQTEQGKKCYAYKLDDQTAWIDISTRLPVYFESKTMQVSYTYSAPPDDLLQLPKKFAEKLEKYKRALRGQM